MEEILEIRDTCKTPIQLLQSNAFEKYLDVYKKLFIRQLKFRENTDQKEEIRHTKTSQVHCIYIKDEYAYNCHSPSLQLLRQQ